MQVASLVALIQERLGVEPICTPGKSGQFDVLVDGEMVATRGGSWLTRKFGAGYPHLEAVVEELKKHGTST